MAPLLEAVAVAILLGAGAAFAWHACGPSRRWLDPTTPGRLLVLLYLILVGAGSVVLVVVDARTDGGPSLAGWGLLAFGVGAQLAARTGGIPEHPPRLDQAGPLRPLVVVALAVLGLAALASILLRTGIPLLTSDALASRAELGGIVFDLFRWLVPPAALIAFGLALVRPGRAERRVAVVVLAAVLGLILAIASRALALELVIGALLIAAWAGRRLALSRWVALAAVAAFLFVSVQLARVASVERFEGPLDVAAYAAERTVGRILLIQPRTLDLVVATIPAEEPYFGGATYVRRLAELAGAEPRPPLGRWIYERLFPSQVPPGFASPGVLGEAWANAGPLLALPGMLLLGLFIQALGRLLARTTAGVADAVFAALITIAAARTYATSLNGFVLTVAVAVAWRLAVAPAPPWLPLPPAFRRRATEDRPNDLQPGGREARILGPSGVAAAGPRDRLVRLTTVPIRPKRPQPSLLEVSMGTILLAVLLGITVTVASNFPSRPSATPMEVVAAAVPDQSVETAIAPAALTPKASVKSGDGLRLDLTSTGAIASVRAGSRTLPRLATTLPGGFSIRTVGGTANVVRNGGFESGKTYWTISGTPAPALATTFRTGTRSLKVSRSTIGDTGSFSQKVAVSPNTNYFAGAWIKTSGVKPSSTGVGNLATTNGLDSPVQIRVDQLNSAGTILSTHWIVGYTDTSGWTKHSVGFRTAPSAKAVKLTGRLNDGYGTAWFDDIWLKPLFSGSESRIGGTVTQVDAATMRQRASISGMTFDTTFKRLSDHIRVSGSLTGTSDKAFRLTWALPVNAVGWRWGDHLRKSRTIASGVTYGQEFSGMIETSRYPFAAVNDGSSGLAVATKLSQPSLSRFRYDSRRGLTVSFDLGVSPAAAGGKTTFNFVLYPFAPSWGMRQAAADFHALEAASFTRRTAAAREGGWYLGDLDPSHPNLDDEDWPKWGLGLHRGDRGGEGSYPWDAARNIYRATYTHHWGHFMTGFAGRPSYDELMARLQSEAAGSGFAADAARATLESGLLDQNGRLRNDLSKWGIRLYQNAAVDPDDYDWTETVQQHQVQPALDAAAAAGAPLDALYMDSASGMRTWGLATDYNREHWGLATRPLTFSYDTGLVTLVNFFQMYEQLKRMSAFLHERGMINAVDYNGDEASPAGYFGADQIDFFAIENGLPERFPASGTGITQDSFALQKRTMAYQKPISILDPKIAAAAANGDLNASELLDVRRRLEQNLFYGFYSGPNKEAPDPWWSSTELRDLYAKYSPIARAINGAGWQPVTRAKSNDSRVWLERFGKNLGTGSPIYITLRNTTGSSLKPTITVSLGSNQSSVRLRELVTGSSLTRTVNGTSLNYAITVPAGTTRVLRITMP